MVPFCATTNLGILCMLLGFMPVSLGLDAECVKTCEIGRDALLKMFGVFKGAKTLDEAAIQCVIFEDGYRCYGQCSASADELKKKKEADTYDKNCEDNACSNKAYVAMLADGMTAGVTGDGSKEDNMKWCPIVKKMVASAKECKEIPDAKKDELTQMETIVCAVGSGSGPSAPEPDSGSPEKTTQTSTSTCLSSACIPVLVLVGLASRLVIGRK